MNFFLYVLGVGGFGLVSLVVQKYIKSISEAAAKHVFDVKIETIKADLRHQEIQIQAEIQRRDAEMVTFRNDVLSTHSARIALLDKRRMEAAEQMWKCVCALEKIQLPAQTLVLLNIEELEKPTNNQHERKLFLKSICGNIDIDCITDEHKIGSERLFLPDKAIRAFDCYSVFIISAISMIHGISLGIHKIQEKYDFTSLINDMISILPNRESYIREYGIKAISYLIPEIKNVILFELRVNVLGGNPQEIVAQTSEIVTLIKSKMNPLVAEGVNLDAPPPPP